MQMRLAITFLLLLGLCSAQTRIVAQQANSPLATGFHQSFVVTTTPTTITMGPGAVQTAAYGVTTSLSLTTITHVTGTDNGTFFVGANAANQVACYYSLGITITHWFVIGFAGSTCLPATAMVPNYFIVPVSVTNGTVSTIGTQYQPVGIQMISAGICALVINTTTVAFDTACQQVVNPVTYSATPTFNYGSGTQMFELTLTGNVTSSTTAFASPGQPADYVICQDPIGGHTFTWPPNFRGAGTVTIAPNLCWVQTFKYDGAIFFATTSGMVE
jgi:hypothetical protein